MIFKKSPIVTFALCTLLSNYCYAKTPNNSSSVVPINSSTIQSRSEKIFTVGEGRATFKVDSQAKTGSDANGKTYSKSFSFPISRKCPGNHHYELMLSLNHVGYNYFQDQSEPNKAQTPTSGQESWMYLNATKLANIENFSPVKLNSDGKSVSSTITINASLAAQSFHYHYCSQHDDVAVCYKHRTYTRTIASAPFTLGFNYTVNCAANN